MYVKKEDKNIYKQISVFGIKYLPSLMAISCSIKIWLLCNSNTPKDSWIYIVNWINVVLNMLLLLTIYSMGRLFGFCWKHKSLCRIAGWGYLWYMLFLIIQPPKIEILGVTMVYLGFVLGITFFYKEIK